MSDTPAKATDYDWQAPSYLTTASQTSREEGIRTQLARRVASHTKRPRLPNQIRTSRATHSKWLVPAHSQLAIETYQQLLSAVLHRQVQAAD
jgi:hypothetical protein